MQHKTAHGDPLYARTSHRLSHCSRRAGILRSLIPNKAAREKSTFDNKVREARKRLTPLAVTEVQKDLLAANMVAFQQVYIV